MWFQVAGKRSAVRMSEQARSDYIKSCEHQLSSVPEEVKNGRGLLLFARCEQPTISWLRRSCFAKLGGIESWDLKGLGRRWPGTRQAVA